MGNLIGLGVFGTFGQPYGFQQTFYYDVKFTQTLDLDKQEIEVFPDSELYAVRREIVDGNATVCFCIYSYAKEANAGRDNTFIGTCIVLPHGFAEAKDIFKLLRELHSDTINNPHNIKSNTLQARQVINLLVRQPPSFPFVKASVKPVPTTPYYCSYINSQKKLIVLPDSGKTANEQDVINFFDEALKVYNDHAALYFTFSDKVINNALNKTIIKPVAWKDFVGYRNFIETQGIVRTKKGIQPNRVVTNMQFDEPALPPQQEPARYDFTEREPEKAPPVQNSSLPFNKWDQPREIWNLTETKKRVEEYNRLLGYVAGNPGKTPPSAPAPPAGTKTTAPKAAPAKTATAIPTPKRIPFWKKRTTEKAPASTGKTEMQPVVGGDTKAPFYKHPKFPLIAFLSGLGIFILFIALFGKKLSKGPTLDNGTSQESPRNGNRKKNHSVSGNNEAAAQAQGDAAGQDAANRVAAPAAGNTKELSPKTNIELTKYDVILLSRTGLKNKPLESIVTTIFQKFPANAGDVYKGQEKEYALTLLNANLSSFQNNNNTYVCTSDTILHIPGYKSPRLPVVFPK